MAYVIYFDSNNVQYRLPVNPEEINIEYGQEINEYDILKLGKIGVPGNEELTVYTFEFELPGKPYNYIETKGGFELPETYLNLFKKHRVNKKPIRFVANNGKVTISELVTVESLIQIERVGEEGDYYCSVTLKQYKPYGIRISVNTSSSGVINNVIARASNPPKPTNYIHVVQAGDTLWALAKRYLGDGSKYSEIANLNNISNPSLIRIGQKITIPGA